MQIYLTLNFILNLFIHQVDIVQAYLKSLLSDNKLPIFMSYPQKFNIYDKFEKASYTSYSKVFID